MHKLILLLLGNLFILSIKGKLSYMNFCPEYPVFLKVKTNELIDFYLVLEDSIGKLKKHWASGIGSFSKEHILKHRTKRFQITEEDIKCININVITFDALIKKYEIKNIKKLIIDTEGFDYKIIKSINFKETSIKEIIFEKKHMSGAFQDEIKILLSKENYQLFDISEENILAKK